ncbi:MAG: C13 family peptidase [Caulobacteraceae bacterium]
MKKALWVLAAAAFLLAACGVPGQPKAPARPTGPSPFNRWAIVVVGGDWRSTDGDETPIFDNARRDVAAAFLKAGFLSRNLAELSVNPGDDDGVEETNSRNFERLAGNVTDGARGCLFYFASHGSEQGIVFGRREGLDPRTMNRLIDNWCGDKPTVVIVSACHSGVFVPALEGPNRMIMTAARSDRSSFGCGGTDTYPYYDACILESLPRSADFIALSRKVKACIERREEEEDADPPSEPQVSIGEDIERRLADMPFTDSSGESRRNADRDSNADRDRGGDDDRDRDSDRRRSWDDDRDYDRGDSERRDYDRDRGGDSDRRRERDYY